MPSEPSALCNPFADIAPALADCAANALFGASTTLPIARRVFDEMGA